MHDTNFGEITADQAANYIRYFHAWRNMVKKFESARLNYGTGDKTPATKEISI